MEPVIDIIIPIYNGERFASHAIAQLKKQTMQCFRAIFIDDGSTDDSYNAFAQALETAPFPYLLLHQENKGAPAARNLGLRHVTAPWIAFMDCDDGLEPEFVEYLYRAVTETGADLAMGSYRIVTEGEPPLTKPLEQLQVQCITPSEAMRLYTTEWIGVYCLLMKRELQQENNLFQDEQCIYCEDAPYIAEVIAAARSVARFTNKTYLYWQVAGSLSHSGSSRKFLSGIQAFQKMEKNFAQSQLPACRAFLECGNARYYVAVLRKAALQLSYQEFQIVAQAVPLKAYRSQLTRLKPKLRLAGDVYLRSHWLFYRIIRLLFKN